MPGKILVLIVTCFAVVPAVGPDEPEVPDSTIEVRKDYVQESLVRTAFAFLGTPYRYGGTTRSGVDCSGFVYAVYREAAGKNLPRMTGKLYTALPPVRGGLIPGDLVFFNTTGGVSHVGMSVGGGRIIHAASRGPQTGVIISSLDEQYYRTRYLGARRVFQYTRPTLYVTIGKTRIQTRLLAPFPQGEKCALTLTNRRKEDGIVVCRVKRVTTGEGGELVRVESGKEATVDCVFAAGGEWVIEFSAPRPGDLVKIEVHVEE